MRLVSQVTGADRGEVGTPPDLRDLDGNWLVCPRVVVTSFDPQANRTATAQKGVPCVRLDLLRQPGGTGSPAGAAGPEGASSDGDGSSAAPVAIGIGALVLVAAGAVVRRRRRSTRADA
jgi:LPXTG-motif cell wall-anchored protein